MVVGHPSRGQTAVEGLAHLCAIKLAQPLDRRSCAGLGLDDEAGDAVVDHLGHRTTVECDDRGPAGHALDHHQAEGSGQSIGNSSACAPDKKAGFWPSLISPMNSTHGLASISGLISFW